MNFLQETEREAEGATFVTEVQSQQPTEQEQLPDYVRNVDVPDTLLNDIKKMCVHKRSPYRAHMSTVSEYTAISKTLSTITEL